MGGGGGHPSDLGWGYYLTDVLGAVAMVQAGRQAQAGQLQCVGQGEDGEADQVPSVLLKSSNTAFTVPWLGLHNDSVFTLEAQHYLRCLHNAYVSSR